MSIADKLTKIAENEPKVFEAGKAEGKQAEYDAFWDAHQEGGIAQSYDCKFASWKHNNFYPKHNIIPTSAYMMFRTYDASAVGQSGDADIVKRLEECGVEMDTSQCTNFQYMCTNSYITHLGKIDTRSAILLFQPFSSGRLHTIDELILKDDGSQTFNAPFHGASALVNITIEGKIGQNGFDLSKSTKLSKASIVSIIGHLDQTEGSPARSITLSLTAVNNAFEGGADGDEFTSVCAGPRVCNWTISLV